MTQKNIPFAITLDVGTSLANRTGSWRTHDARRTSTACRRAMPSVPPGEQCQAWLFFAGSRATMKAPGSASSRTIRFRPCMGRVCYHTCETACNRGELDESVGINSVERFLGDNALAKRLEVRSPKTEDGQEGARGGRRPRRPFRGLPSAPAWVTPCTWSTAPRRRAA